MKTKIYTLIFALLLVFVAYTLYSKSSAEKESKKDKNFKVENFNEVTKIFIENKAGKTMTLNPSKNGWVLNNKYPVRKHLFENLKEVLTKMEPNSPVAKIATKNVIFEMMQNAIKVSIFKGADMPEKVIYIGGPNLQATASNMFIEYDGVPSNKIYQVQLPGHRGYLTSRFLINEEEWRSKQIFDYSTASFKSINIQYFNEFGKENFTLFSDNHNYSLLLKDKKIPHEKLNDKEIVNYILNLKNQNTMAYVFPSKEEKAFKDSLLNVKKFAEIEITDIKDNKIKMTIVDMPLKKTSNKQYDENGDPMAYDIDYKYIIFGVNDDWGIVSREKFGKLYIDPNSFIK